MKYILTYALDQDMDSIDTLVVEASNMDAVERAVPNILKKQMQLLGWGKEQIETWLADPWWFIREIEIDYDLEKMDEE